MKRTLLIFLVVFITLSSANAQFTKIGGGLGFTTGYYFHGMKYEYNKSGNLNVSVKAIYELNLPFHIAPSITFFFPHTGKVPDYNGSTKGTVTTIMADINAHWVFNSLDRFEFYAIAGPDILVAWKQEVITSAVAAPIKPRRETDNGLGLNLGLGTYIKIAQQMDLNIEAKYLVGHFHQFMVNAGVLVNLQYIIKHKKEPI